MNLNAFNRDALFKKQLLKKMILIMRMIVIIMTTCLIQVSAASFAQRINLVQKNASLATVLDEISKQSGYQVLYSSEKIDVSKRMDANFRNTDLKEVLETCLSKQGFSYAIEDNVIMIKKRAPSFLDNLVARFSAIDIRGKIIGENDQVLAGATVKVKGSNKITKSNENGEFYLANVDEDAVLEISYVGYKALEISLRGAVMPLEIRLSVATGELEEVNVIYNTGYQNIDKTRATGSFVQIENKLYNEQVGINVLDRLESIVNGLQVDRKVSGTAANGKFLIRGISTMTPSIMSPLIVVDDFPYEGNINNIDPNTVESVTVLKDAAAASIWGTRAGNGVIVITTKKGKFNQTFTTDFSANTTITDKPDLFYVKNISSSTFVDFERDLFSKGFYTGKENDAIGRVPLSPVVELLISNRNKSITNEQLELSLNNLRQNDVRNDFNKYVYRNAFNRQYGLNFRGGSNALAYVFSAGYNDNKTELSGGYTRLNISTQTTFKPLRDISITGGVTYTDSKDLTGKTGYQSTKMGVNNLPPYSRLVDENGNPAFISQYRQTYIDTAGKGKLANWKYFPLEDYKHNVGSVKVRDMLFNLGTQYQLNSNLKFDVKYQYQKQQSVNRILQDKDSYYTRDLVNRFTRISGSTVTYAIPNQGILDLTNTDTESQSLRGQVNFDQDWDVHTIHAIMGMETRQIINSFSGQRAYGYDEELLRTASVDYITRHRQYISGLTDLIPDRTNFGKTNNRFLSFYANAGYTYRSRYTVSGSIRRDGSNLFGVTTNDKWKPLWSAGLGWNLSEEDFYKLHWLPYLKLRATLGYSGNIDPNRTTATTIEYLGTNPATSTPLAQFRTYYNPGLRWEEVRMLNFALDFRTKNNIVNGSVEYYNKKSTDLFGQAPIDPTVGISSNTVVKNVAEIAGSGLDIQINTINLNRNVKWLSQINLNFYKDKVQDYYLPTLQGLRFVGGNAAGPKGYPVNGVYSYRWAGLDPNTGDPQGYINGVVSKDYTNITNNGTQFLDLLFSGSALPKVYGTLGNTLSYKSFSITARLSYKFGHYFKRSSIYYTSLFNNYIGHGDYEHRWIKTGDENMTTVPSMVYPANSNRDLFYNNSEVLVSRGDHIRLNYVTLSYSIEGAKLKPFKTVQFFINASNLGILWKTGSLDIDPDYADTSIPPSKNISFGLKTSL
ncbi:SusC/RagA family TonB-linked outer membrane protein [Pedobacter frigoris]|uniref:SusC/RagA family TonB-linked outer membrane protein n=1 Tax=Pedobacter frigoris TaxID=2571272 RepID=A0A4U1CPP5_9SPHI|nr:SusC/RagA family TonB-linked outer membrane protein [Pedobacter frigoris]TKC09246.1 SusC/RagA family TonB-linked outer membrane protein [Pedobacter frigoris]